MIIATHHDRGVQAVEATRYVAGDPTWAPGAIAATEGNKHIKVYPGQDAKLCVKREVHERHEECSPWASLQGVNVRHDPLHINRPEWTLGVAHICR